jgi:hypothetical protein
MAGLALLALAAVRPGAAEEDVCARANERLAQTGRGDRDYDGLSNCVERFQTGTAFRDADTDDDGLDDGDEVADGTDPLEEDSDDDGASDGEETDSCTDPNDPDSDGDGEVDGDDPDPEDELESVVEGPLESIDCPSGDTAGSLVVLGMTIALPAGTDFEHVTSCEALAEHLATAGAAHVEVEVTGDAASGLTAVEVELEDEDLDGSPDDVDEDDDGDGTPDDDDEDEDEDDEGEDEDGDGDESEDEEDATDD